MIEGLLVFFILTTLVASALAYVNYVKYTKAIAIGAVYLSFISRIFWKVKETQQQLKEVDRRGSFKADDEVGFTFTAINDCVEELLNFLLKYVSQEETEKQK